MFWTIAALIAAAAGFTLVRSAQAGAETSAQDGDATDVAIYKAQLAEVDRDLTRSVISEDEAEALRTEIARRLLAADAAAATEPGQSAKAPLGLTIALAVITMGIGIGTYLWIGAPGYGDMPLQARLENMQQRADTRPTQALAQRSFAATSPTPTATDQHRDLVDQLRAAVRERPGDLRGLALLARNEALLGNFTAAISARAQIVAVREGNATAADHRDLAELMIVATGGYVSPEAEAVLRTAFDLDPSDEPTRYYLGLMYDQIGRADLAYALWNPLVEQSTGTEPWLGPILQQMPGVADRAGLRFVPPDQRGPTAADLAAAEDMTPEDRAAMIAGMVDSLSERLATEGGPPEDWARLISAHMVLGNVETAREILAEARFVFQDRADALTLFNRVAVQSGLE